MAKFKVGDKVIYVENNSHGIVTEVYPLEMGQQYYAVTWIGSGEQDDYPESRLEAERKLDNPFELISEGIFRPFGDFSRLNTQHKIENTSVNTISSLKASRTIFKPYQYKPLLKFLNSECRRLLIADEVGLGKTIEAGHIMLELKARHELSNALIICPKSLAEKWRDELQFRFDFNFKVYESRKDFTEDVRTHRPIFGIVTYESTVEKSKNDLYETLVDNNVKLDLVICDEAHKLRNDNTGRHDGAERILSITKSAIFLTATPIMLDESNLFHLLQLLDPLKFRSEVVFKNLQNTNKPFVAAVSQLNAKVPFSEIADNLEGAKIRFEYKQNGEYAYEMSPVTVKDEYKDIPLFHKIMSDLRTLDETDVNRVKIQHDINSISVLSNIFSRTTKREITTDWTQAERRPQTITVSLSEEEQQIYDRYMEQQCISNPLAESQHKKIMASSIIANATPWYGMRSFPSDSKYNALSKILEDVVKNQGKKLIIFATQINTLEYLQHRMASDGIRSNMIHGQIKDRHKVLEEFRDNPNINVLLSSEVGGEGLDMQFCDTLVNYDLPWNPMVVEQRIGRIDRFGQKSKVVHIYNILVKGTLAEKIYNRLLNRIGIFRECIGDIEVILDRFLERVAWKKDFVSYLEKELETDELSEDEIQRKTESISKALEQEKLDVEHLAKGLTDTLTNDMYFKEEIRKIRHESRYVTENELLSFVRNIIDTELKTCRLKEIEPNRWQLIAQKGDANILINFLTKYKPVNADKGYEHYINTIREEHIFEMTFSQDYAFEHKDCEYINIYHPIIQAGKEYFSRKSDSQPNTFKLSLSREFLPENISCGRYVLGIYLLDIEKEVFHYNKHTPMLVPVVYDCESGAFIDDDSADQFFSAIQENASYLDGMQKEELGRSVQFRFSEKVGQIQDTILEDQRIRSESNKKILIQRTKAMYEREIDQLRYRVLSLQYSNDSDKQSMVKATQGLLDKKIEEMNSELKSLESSIVTANPYKQISLSIISVQ